MRCRKRPTRRGGSETGSIVIYLSRTRTSTSRRCGSLWNIVSRVYIRASVCWEYGTKLTHFRLGDLWDSSTILGSVNDESENNEDHFIRIMRMAFTL